MVIENYKTIIKWWEGKRRFRFNLAFIGSGIACLVAVFFINRAAVNFFMLPWLFIYVLAGNCFYLFVWCMLILLSKMYKTDGLAKSPLLYRLVIFGFCALNALLACLLWWQWYGIKYHD
jgi:hypothetical protein